MSNSFSSQVSAKGRMAPARGRSAQGKRVLVPVIILVCMLVCLFLTGVIFPLTGPTVHQVFPGTPLEQWLLLPTQYLFPYLAQQHAKGSTLLSIPLNWVIFLLLGASFLLLFVCYLCALRFLPRMVTRRFVLLSTTLLGLLCVLYPSIPSQDLFSYISYARLEVIYHLNPLIATPHTIMKDPIYHLLYWKDQPSAYGPTWIGITSGLQRFSLLFVGGIQNIFVMAICLRCFGLVVHLCSTHLIWVISGSLQSKTGRISTRLRVLATLAFAWNPLLLLEAAAIVHNDTTVLLCVLLAVWSLQGYRADRPMAYVLASIFLALAACLKITFLVLAPGLLLFLWVSRGQSEGDMRGLSRMGAEWVRCLCRMMVVIVVYIATIVVVYLPFWQNGAVLHFLQVNPSFSRDINSPYEFFIRLYDSLKHQPYPVLPTNQGIPLERESHTLSLWLYAVVFCVVSGLFLVWRHAHALVAFIQWMTVIWLLYCIVGSPWLWPWYFIAFFGLFALLEVIEGYSSLLAAILRVPLAARLLTFAALLLYMFVTVAPQKTFVLLPYFEVSYLRGMLLCVIPLLALFPRGRRRMEQQRGVGEPTVVVGGSKV